MLLERYVVKTIAVWIGFVTLMLAGLQIFILFVNQLGALGKGQYGITQAMYFVFMQVPYQVYLFFPMASLFGSLVGLGFLASNRELIVMRTSGMSIWQVTYSVLKAALFLSLMVSILGEVIAPQLVHMANDNKIEALSGGKSLRTGHGMWLHYQNDFISVSSVLSDKHLKEVYQFRFDDKHMLRLARKIGELNYENNTWIGHNIAETIFEKNGTHGKHLESMNWDVPLKPTIFGVANTEPDEMTLHELKRYLRDQKVTNQQAFNFRLSFWQRIFEPVTTLVMIMLSVPFIFGPLRSSTMGSKLMLGALVGFGFSILNRFFGPISQLFQWDPAIAAILPTSLFALICVYLMLRL